MKEMFDAFSHFLAFGISDQQTLRNLTSEYDGMIVPGTIAAYQSDPTRGFVLSLSAAEHLPYAIDSRFPLFQSHLADPKPSHLLLAGIFGMKSDSSGNWLRGDALSEESLRAIASNWISFNTRYTELKPETFDKYARRLKKALPQKEASGPRWILPPYLMKDEDFPQALDVSERLWRYSLEAARERNVETLLRRVVAVEKPEELYSATKAASQSEVVVWVSNLDETKLENLDLLANYARSIRLIRADDVTPFALYGGYFAVMLRSLGLAGASHGVGFSEYRHHVELKTSGAAPARFYVARLHRFVNRDLASELWRRRPDLVDCDYSGYVSRDPAELDYHELMEHSVRARQQEILHSVGSTIDFYIDQLEQELVSFRLDLDSITLTTGLGKRALELTPHLGMWAEALRRSRA